MVACQGTDQSVVLHAGHVGKAADLSVESGRHEQGLIAIGQLKPRGSPMHDAFHGPKPPAGSVEAESERAGRIGVIADAMAHLLRPAGRECGVGVQEQQDVTASHGSAQTLLTASGWWA